MTAVAAVERGNNMSKIFILILFIALFFGCSKKETPKIEKSPRAKLVEKISKQTNLQKLAPQSGSIKDFKKYIEEMKKNPQTSPVVSLEDFFEGNSDEGSIGCNLYPHPGIKIFYVTLKAIRDREDVQDVLVEISAIDDDVSWPFSEFIWIISKAPKDKVFEWVKPLKPDEINEGWGKAGKPSAAPEPKEPMTVYGVWWD